MMPEKGDKRGPTSRREHVPARRRPERPPPEDTAAPPLTRFSTERLASFLELALRPDELLQLARRTGVKAKAGYRIEKLDASAHAQLLAEDYLSQPKTRAPVELAVLEALKTPALKTLWLTPIAAVELAQLLAGDPVSAEARLAWRCIGDGDPALRKVASQAIDHGLSLLEGIEDEAQKAPESTGKTTGLKEGGARLQEIEKRAERAEKEREGARAQLQQARAEIAERDKRISELRQEATQLRVEQAAHLAELSRLQTTQTSDERRGATALRKLSAEKSHLEGRLGELEERLEAERRRSVLLERQIAERERPALNLPPGEGPLQESSANDFIVPLFTHEFYASLEGWDRRVVKVAFEKALLLAKDRRHPSLRALPLEGIDNLFRIRIASDVRLVYRRGEDGRIELLALLDREDLDRYVRQAKTRNLES